MSSRTDPPSGTSSMKPKAGKKMSRKNTEETPNSNNVQTHPGHAQYYASHGSYVGHVKHPDNPHPQQHAPAKHAKRPHAQQHSTQPHAQQHAHAHAQSPGQPPQKHTAGGGAQRPWRSIDLPAASRQMKNTDGELLYLLEMLGRLREENRTALDEQSRMKRDLEHERVRVEKIEDRLEQDGNLIAAERADSEKLFAEAGEAYKRLVGSSDTLVHLMHQEQRNI